MKPTTIAKSALALALGTVACAAYADLTENFDAIAVGTAIVGQTTNSLTWSGAGDASYVTNNPTGTASDHFLQVQTEGATLTATIDSTETNTLNTALAAGRDVTFRCTAKLEPTDSLEDISGSDVKFALYAYAHDNTTNLVVYGFNPSLRVATNNVTSIVLTGGEVAIEVTITNAASAKGFTVKVGSSSVAGPFGLASDSEISALDITGSGTIDDIAFAAAAAGYVAGNTVPSSDGTGSIELTASEADYLNDVVVKGHSTSDIETALGNMTRAQLDEAQLLDTDFVSNGAPTNGVNYSFAITSIAKSGTDIVVTITLDRPYKIGDQIHGKVILKKSVNGTDWSDVSSITITGAKFITSGEATTATATATFPQSGNGNFFKAEIVVDPED